MANEWITSPNEPDPAAALAAAPVTAGMARVHELSASRRVSCMAQRLERKEHPNVGRIADPSMLSRTDRRSELRLKYVARRSLFGGWIADPSMLLRTDRAILPTRLWCLNTPQERFALGVPRRPVRPLEQRVGLAIVDDRFARPVPPQFTT